MEIQKRISKLTRAQLVAFCVRCLEIDEFGNTGTYDLWTWNADASWLNKRWAKPLRDGIIFYSTGWGWRVRRKPMEWSWVFCERFGEDIFLEAERELKRKKTMYNIDEIPF